MNRVDYDLHWNVFECTGFVFSELLIVFMISVTLNSRKVNISLLLKCSLIFLVQ